MASLVIEGVQFFLRWEEAGINQASKQVLVQEPLVTRQEMIFGVPTEQERPVYINVYSIHII